MAGDYEFKWPDYGLPRKAYRISLPGLVVRIKKNNQFYVVKDISACGLAFRPLSKDEDFQVDQVVRLSLIFKKRLIVKELLAKVVRRQEKIVACEFIELDHRQEYRLDKFVLEVQKEMINKKKASGKIDE